MIYELSHYTKEHFPFLWQIVEWLNSLFFVLLYKKELRKIPDILAKNSEKYKVEEVVTRDIDKLAIFFSEQPIEAFTFFNPHGFDHKSLAKLVRRKSFLMFKVMDGNVIIGYFFLRCFANGNAFKGRIVDSHRRNQGIAKLMGCVINEVVKELYLRLYTTISPENYSSLASTKAVNNIKIVRTLENGYYYIECTPKDKNEKRHVI